MIKILLFISALLLPSISIAAGTDSYAATTIVQDALNISTSSIANELQATAFKMLSLFMMLQWFITNFKTMMSGADIQTVLAKAFGLLAWGSVVFFAMDHAVSWLTQLSTFFYEKAGAVAGTSFSPGYVMEFGISTTASLLNAVDQAQGILESLNPLPAIMMGFCSFVILLITGLIAFKIFMLLAETTIVIALAPFSIAFAGLSALKEQGLVPFKYMISMAYRAMIYAAVVAVIGQMGAHITSVFSVVATLPEGDIWDPIFAIILGYGMIGALAFKADSIATMLASGTSQMTAGDAGAVATAAAAAGGAIGGGVLGAATTAAGGTTAAPKAMSEFISHMTSGDSGKAGQGFSTPQLNDAPPKPQSAPAPTPSSSADKAMADAGSKATGGKAPEGAVNAGVDALGKGGSKGEAMAAMINHGATPNQAKTAVDAMRPDGDEKGAGIGGSSPAENPSNPSSGVSGRSLADSLESANRHLQRDDARVNVSMNVSAE